jgi:hypothetical protein
MIRDELCPEKKRTPVKLGKGCPATVLFNDIAVTA